MEAEQQSDPVTACLTLIGSTTVLLWTGEWEKADVYIESLLQIANGNTLEPYRMVAIGLRGDLLVRQGDPSTGVRLLRESLAGLRANHYELLVPWLKSTMAEGLAALGQFDLALAQLEETIASIGAAHGAYNGPELLRVYGELLIRAGNERDAEQLFRESLDVADKSAALSWRLRSATSLARLLVQQARSAEARTILSNTYARFEEGFETADLRMARALLGELDSPPT